MKIDEDLGCEFRFSGDDSVQWILAWQFGARDFG
jgi:hypothetical protein